MVPDPWSPRRASAELPGRSAPAPLRWTPARELVLALVVALLAAGVEDLLGESGPRLLAVALGSAGCSLLRRRLPVPVLAVTAALGGVVGGFFLVMPLVAWSAGRRIEGAGRALAAFSVGYVLYLAGCIAIYWSGRMPFGLTLVTTLAYLATAVVPGLASRYWSQRRTLLQALRERNAQLVREHRMIAGQARLLERQRIAQDMHDSLGHQLALISVHSGALEVDPELTERQREAVGVLRNSSVAAMHELREVVGILRDGAGSSEAPVGESERAARGTAGIHALVEAAGAAGKTVVLRRSGEQRPLPAAADHAAYRIVQEALTNAYKHAPGAPIGVELRYEPDSLVVEIVSGVADPAAAGDAVSGGQGLTGLRERARLVGGIVHAGPMEGGGFRVAGVLPYGAVEAAPFVPADDDFPQQAPAAPHGQGVPAMHGDTTVREPVIGALDKRHGRAGGTGLGCGISLAVVVMLVATLVVGGYVLVISLEGGMIDRSTYDAVEIGADEDAVRGRLPNGDTFFTRGLGDKKEAPGEPAGSECLVLMSEEISDSWDKEPVFRFCFKGGKLIEKRSYEVTMQARRCGSHQTRRWIAPDAGTGGGGVREPGRERAGSGAGAVAERAPGHRPGAGGTVRACWGRPVDRVDMGECEGGYGGAENPGRHRG
ncbi:histidine kinase [Streptomyces sp. NPDC051018]|uniref:sensor histidine kinase n=1 Tax=Streptomyces sp. NPDC051018 TaxID=3365639 RepID=UPI0037AF47AF